MNKQTSSVSKTEQKYSISLLTYSSSKPFDVVVSDFEKQLGRFDEARALSSGAGLTAAVDNMKGSSGLMILAVLPMDRTLPALISSSIRAVQYLVGNPLIASSMAEHNTLAALYAPPRVLIYTEDGKTCISYDQPSDIFGRLASTHIDETARDLNEKFERLVKTALS
jgi:uncharacterized protein (DUF302 family)